MSAAWPGVQVVVVITTWNTPRPWLVDAVASVLADAQGADTPETGIVLVDDASDREYSPPHRPEVAHYHAFALAHRHGVGAASNAGIEAALRLAPDARYLARLDADDTLVAGRIRRQHRLLEDASLDLDVVAGGMLYMAPGGQVVGQHLGEPYCGPIDPPRIAHGTTMYRRELWERAGGYPELAPGRRGQDQGFWKRCENVRGRLMVVADPLIRRRIHPGSLSFARSAHLQWWWHLIVQQGLA